jgi:hypothetical protein
MRASDLIIGESYRHKEHPDYCWARVVKILKPKEEENPHNRIIVKCEYSVGIGDSFGLIKYFKPSDLVKPVVNLGATQQKGR